MGRQPASTGSGAVTAGLAALRRRPVGRADCVAPPDPTEVAVAVRPALATELPTSTAATSRAAAARARAAQPAWARPAIEERAELLLGFHDRLLDRRDDFVDLVQYEAGKARLSATEEVLHVALTARYYARTAGATCAAERGAGMLPLLTRIDRHYVPKGLVGVIAPWNYPLTMAISDGLAALVAGNAVLLSRTRRPRSAPLAAVDLLRRVRHARRSVAGGERAGRQVGPATDRRERLRLLHRIDGHRAHSGRPVRRPADRLLARAGRQEPAAGPRRRGRRHGGRGRGPGLLLQRRSALCLHRAALRRRAACSTASPRRSWPDPRAAAGQRHWTTSYDMGGLINAGQLERVSAHVEDARAKGATVLTGGRRRPDLGELFYEPTVLTGVTAEMDCYAEETFGPVVSIYPVARRRRGDRAGQRLRVRTERQRLDRGRRRVAGWPRRSRCGTVNVNEGFAATFGSLDAPMGGMKTRDWAVARAATGFRRFVEVQSVATQYGSRWRPSLGSQPGHFVRACQCDATVPPDLPGRLAALRRGG